MPLLKPEEYTVEALMADLPMQRSARSQLQAQLLTLKEGIALFDNPIERSPITRHTVNEQETLQIVSLRQYGTPDYWLEIARANQIDYPYLVHPGQILQIPEIAGQ